jgi:hypothetical protein
VPARRPPLWELRVERGQVRRWVSAEGRPDGPDEALNGAQPVAAGRTRDHGRRLSEQPGRQVHIGDERSERAGLIEGAGLAHQRSNLANLSRYRARVSTLGKPSFPEPYQLDP